MGFYPVCPGSDEYVITAPAIPSVTMTLSNGKKLVIDTENYSDKNDYIQSVKINEVEWNKSWFSFNDIKEGGHIHFVLGDTPNKEWASAEEHYPPSMSNNEL